MLKRRMLVAEIVTLFGMALVVASQFGPWERGGNASDAVVLPAFYRQRGPLGATQNGFAAGVWLPLTLCATLAGVTLLINCTAKNRAALRFIQGACGLTCLVIPLARFALLPGVILALLGGALIAGSALSRCGGEA